MIQIESRLLTYPLCVSSLAYTLTEQSGSGSDFSNKHRFLHCRTSDDIVHNE